MTNLAAEARAKVQGKYPGAVVDGRGKKWIRHQHPTNPNKFIFDSHIGPIHYGSGEDQEIDTAWQASSGEWDYEAVENDFRCYVRDSVPVSYRYEDVASGHYVELTWEMIQWVNDEDDSENAAAFSQVTPTIADDLITWPDVAAGWHVAVNAQTARLQKRVTIDSLAELGAPTIGGTNERLRFRLTFQMSSGLDVWADGEKWSAKNNTWLETGADLEFRDEGTGEPVFWFAKPWARDESEEQPIITQRVRRTGVNYYAEIDVPWSWLETAVFPIVIDPTVDYQVGAASDDARETNAGAMSLDISGFQLDRVDEWFAFRWTGVTIPDGSTIDAATVDFCIVNSSQDEPDIVIDFEDGSAPGTFTTGASDISNRTGTTASVELANADMGVTTGNEFASTLITLPELKTIVQELEDSYDYSSGSSMVCRFTGRSGMSANSDLGLVDYSTNSALAAKLHIEYTAAGGGDISVSGVAESGTLGESVSVSLPDALAAAPSDDVTVGEAVTAVLEDLAIDESEDVTVGEAVTAVLDDLAIDESEDVTVGEAVTAVLDDLAIDESEEVTVGESVDATVTTISDANVSASEDVTVGEAVTAVLDDLAIDESEDVTVGEAVDATVTTISDANVSASEDVTVGEAVTAVLEDLAIDESEDVTVGEAVDATVTTISDANVSASEDVTAGEAVTVALDDLAIDASEDVTVGESVNVTIAAAGELDVNVTDSVSAGDSAASEVIISVSAVEAVTVGDTVIVYFEGAAYQVDVSDGLTVGESLIVNFFFDTPDDRVYAIGADDRVYAIDADDRTYAIAAENRTLSVKS